MMGKVVCMKGFSLGDLCLVGNELLDAQHKIILSHMGKVYTYLLADNKGRDLFEVVDSLDINCKLHFLDEEKVMEEMDFPEIEEHRSQHALFVTHLKHFMGRHAELNIDELIFLKGWSLEHFETFDSKYAAYKKQLINERICSSW
jgi:hemerythrin-like metal-binding protein